MSHSPDNPFDRFELDPASDLAAITDALRDRAEQAAPTERAAIRAAWEALTLHPARRLELALTAVPETRAPLGRPPPRVALSPRGSPREAALELTDLVALEPAADALGEVDEAEAALLAPRRFMAR